MPEGTRLMLLAPMVRGRKGQHKEVFEAIRKAGFNRARVDGMVVDLDSPPELTRQKTHQIEAVVDRVVIREGVRNRLAESIKLAVRHGDDLVLATYEEKRPDGPAVWHDLLFSTQYACPNCKISYEELEPRTFSFNSPYGACPTCEGLGVRVEFDPELVVPDLALSLAGGAMAPLERRRAGSGRRSIQAALRRLHGGGRIPLEYAAGEARTASPGGTAAGRRPRLSRRAGDAGKAVRRGRRRARRQRLEAFRGEVVLRRIAAGTAAGGGPRGPPGPAGRSTRSRP